MAQLIDNEAKLGIHRMLINLKICHRFRNSQFITDEAITFYFNIIHSNSIISSLGLLLSGYRTKILCAHSYCHIHSTCPRGHRFWSKKWLLLFLGLLLLRNSDKSYSRCNIQIEKFKFPRVIQKMKVMKKYSNPFQEFYPITESVTVTVLDKLYWQYYGDIFTVSFHVFY